MPDRRTFLAASRIRSCRSRAWSLAKAALSSAFARIVSTLSCEMVLKIDVGAMFSTAFLTFSRFSVGFTFVSTVRLILSVLGQLREEFFCFIFELAEGVFVGDYVVGYCDGGADSDIEFPFISFGEFVPVLWVVASSAVVEALVSCL